MSLLKLAASYDARRKKQYWQLLKRLHGGTEDTVAALRKSRDPGIYHGTNTSNVNKIKREGLIVGGGAKKRTDNFISAWGEENGVFLGDRENARSYARDLARNRDERGLLQLKKPSDLKNTKTLYPNVSRAQTTVVDGPDVLMVGGETIPYREKIHRQMDSRMKQIPEGKALFSKRLREAGIEDPKRPTEAQKETLRNINKELFDLANPFDDPAKLNKVRYFGRKGPGYPSVSDWDGKQFHYLTDVPANLLKSVTQ